MKLKVSIALALSIAIVFPALGDLAEAVKAFKTADYAAAYPELLALSQEGDAEATYYLGRIYNEGLGIEADKDKAIRLFEQADKAYYVDATVALGKMALKGEGTTQDIELGQQYLKKAAYAGSEDALYELGLLYEKGAEELEKNYTHSFGYYYMSALKGDKRAQVKVARSYLNGRGIPQDFVAAQRWYVRAANQGYIPAQEEWAKIRISNPRLRNALDAYSWYSILAAYNSDDVGKRAASMRDKIGAKFQSNVLSAQQKRIKEWRPISASASVPAAERRDAVLPVIPGFNDPATIKTRLEAGAGMRLDGSAYGVSLRLIQTAAETKDLTKLEAKITAAAEKGQIAAYGYYGDLLRERFSDEITAVNWYRKGAEAGDSYARYQLGKSYCEGRGINPPDVSECYAWLLMAKNDADKNMATTIRDAITALEEAATPEELSRGKERYAQLSAPVQSETETKKKSPGLLNLF